MGFFPVFQFLVGDKNKVNIWWIQYSISMERKNLLLLICTVLSFFTVFAVNAVTIVIPSIAAEFHMSNIIQNWVTIIFLLVVAVLSVPAGQISAKYGLKKVTIASIVLFIIIFICLFNIIIINEKLWKGAKYHGHKNDTSYIQR